MSFEDNSSNAKGGFGLIYKSLFFGALFQAGRMFINDAHKEAILECLETGFSQCYYFQSTEETFKLTEEEKNKVIKEYLLKDNDIKVKDGCQIGVGYNACTDINFNAAELLALLEPKIVEIEKKEGK